MQNKKIIKLFFFILTSMLLYYSLDCSATTTPVRHYLTYPISLKVNHIFDINTQNSTFKTMVSIEIKHPTLKPNPLDDIAFPDAYNKKLLSYTTDQLADGSYLSSGKYILTIGKHFDLSQYPFEKHKLSIVLENEKFGHNTRYLLSNNMSQHNKVIQKTALPSGWRLLSSKLNVSLYRFKNALLPNTTPDTWHSRLSYTLIIKRSDLRLFFLIFSTLYLAYFLNLYTLFLPLHQDFAILRNSLIVTSIFSYIGNYFVTSNLLINTLHFSLVDKIQTLVLLLMLATLIVTTIVTKKIEQNKLLFGTEKKVRQISCITSILLFIVGNYWALQGG